jgi:nitrate reductase NapE component
MTEEQDKPVVSAEGTVNLFALLVFLTAVLSIAFLGAFLIGVGYAVWPVLVAALS